MSKHTPGPWHWSGDSLTHRQFNIYAPSSAPQEHVCTVNNLSPEKLDARDADVALANARLIAAAPDLLEVLKYCRSKMAYIMCHGEWYTPEKAIKLADEAIAKAEGGTP